MDTLEIIISRSDYNNCKNELSEKDIIKFNENPEFKTDLSKIQILNDLKKEEKIKKNDNIIYKNSQEINEINSQKKDDIECNDFEKNIEKDLKQEETTALEDKNENNKNNEIENIFNNLMNDIKKDENQDFELTKKDKIIINKEKENIEKEETLIKEDLKESERIEKKENGNLSDFNHLDNNNNSESESENDISEIMKNNKNQKINKQSDKSCSNKIENNKKNIDYYNNPHCIYNKNIQNNNILNYELTQNIGFKNIGHTCYMNSFLQILLHIPTFLPKIKELYFNKVNKDTLIYNLIKLSEDPYNTKYLKEIKTIIAKSYPKYGPYEQNDTQNFAIDFIDTIINEIKNETSFVSESNDQDENFKITTIKDNIIYKKKKYAEFLCDFEKSGEKTFLEDLFLLIESTIRYTGQLINQKKVRFDLLLNVELTFPTDNLKKKYSLYELLNIKYNNFNSIINDMDIINEVKISSKHKNRSCFFQYLKNFLGTINLFGIFNSCINEKENEDLEEVKYKDMNNENINMPEICMNNNLEEINEISKIIFLPKILIISFDRGIEGKDLISSFISFDEELELKEYIDKDLCDQNLGTKYYIFGINIREGNTKNFGHCYSYVKVNKEWICYNDSTVKKEKPSFTLNSVVGLYYIHESILKKQ